MNYNDFSSPRIDVLRVTPYTSGNPGLANVNEAKDSERAIGETTAAPDTLLRPPSLTRNTVIVTDTNRMDRLDIPYGED